MFDIKQNCISCGLTVNDNIDHEKIFFGGATPKKHILLHIWHFGSFWVKHTITKRNARPDSLPKAKYQPFALFNLISQSTYTNVIKRK